VESHEPGCMRRRTAIELYGFVNKNRHIGFLTAIIRNIDESHFLDGINYIEVYFLCKV